MNEALCKSILQLCVCVCGALGILGQCLHEKKQKELYFSGCECVGGPAQSDLCLYLTDGSGCARVFACARNAFVCVC